MKGDHEQVQLVSMWSVTWPVTRSVIIVELICRYVVGKDDGMCSVRGRYVVGKGGRHVV